MGRPRLKDESLPCRVYLRSGGYYYVDPQGKWTNLGRDYDAALEQYRTLAEADGVKNLPQDFFAQLYTSAKARAKRRGMEFQIDAHYVRYLFEKSGGKCALTGIQFDCNFGSAYSRRPWAPSLDRIDSKIGYVEGNCRLVCVAVNTALNEWGLDVLRTIAEALLEYK